MHVSSVSSSHPMPMMTQAAAALADESPQAIVGVASAGGDGSEQVGWDGAHDAVLAAQKHEGTASTVSCPPE
jgi:hypothetical protein